MEEEIAKNINSVNLAHTEGISTEEEYRFSIWPPFPPSYDLLSYDTSPFVFDNSLQFHNTNWASASRGSVGSLSEESLGFLGRNGAGNYCQSSNAGSTQFRFQGPEQIILPQTSVVSFQVENDTWPAFSGMTEAPRDDEQFLAGSLTYLGDELPNLTIQVYEEKISPNQPVPTRHPEKHVRHLNCTHRSCDSKSFRDKHSLERHLREVHGSQTFTCPVSSCPRSKRGFNRKYNLWDHRKRQHQHELGDFPLGSSMASDASPDDRSQTLPCDDGVLQSGRDDVDQPLDVAEDSETKGEQKILRSKLKSLKLLRADIDKDIASLERVLNLVVNA